MVETLLIKLDMCHGLENGMKKKKESLFKNLFFVFRCTEACTWAPDPTEFPCKRILCPSFAVPPGTTVAAGNMNDQTFGSEMTVQCQLYVLKHYEY